MAYYGISARNEGQRAAVRALTNDKPLLFLTGPAGTGKTLITQAVGLHRLTDAQDYRKLIYTRMQTQIGIDLGALPGTVDEKTYPFMRPFLDNLDAMAPSAKSAYHYLTSGGEDKRRLFFEAMQTMRGGTWLNYFTMADEIQNVDAHVIGTIATRPSIGTKIVFLGNFAQIDDERLRKPANNGLYRLLNGLYEEGADEYFDHVNLTEVQRHPVVDVVERILRNHDMPTEFAELEARGNVN